MIIDKIIKTKIKAETKANTKSNKQGKQGKKTITLKVDKDWLDMVNRWAKKNNMSRHHAIKCLVMDGIFRDEEIKDFYSIGL